MTKHIIPRYKLMLFYDLASDDMEEYYQFVMTEMVPTVSEMGLYLFRAFHTIPGQPSDDHRLRQIEYIAEDLETVSAVLDSETWHSLEDKLLQYVTNYQRKIVRFRQGFQL